MVDFKYIGYGTYYMSIRYLAYHMLHMIYQDVRNHYMIIVRDKQTARIFVDPSPPD